MELTAEEANIINSRRRRAELESKRERFYSEVMRVAHEWRIWAVNHGEGLTFSTFIDQFNAPDRISSEFMEDLKLIYKAVLDTLNTAAAYANRIN